MKFVVAIGILAQTLPAVSEKTFDLARILASVTNDANGPLPSTNALRPRGGRRSRFEAASFQKQLKRKVSPMLMNKPTSEEAKPCNPSSDNADVGILSCGKGKVCQVDENVFLGGKCVSSTYSHSYSFGKSNAFTSFGKGIFLKNRRDATKNADEGSVECDPSGGADIGILSCGEGIQCLPNSASSMGGFCAQEGHSRRLYHLTTEPGICDPTHPDYLAYDCDCTGFDNATGTGDIPCTDFENYCLGLSYPGCVDTCVTRTLNLSFKNFTAPSYSFCVDVETPYAQKVCFEETFETESCEITFNDEICTSCTINPSGNGTSISFDCVNVGGRAVDAIYDLTDVLPIVDSCFMPGTFPECSLCPDSNSALDYNLGGVLVDIPDLGEFTCMALFYLSYDYMTITEDYCPAVSTAATESCCSYYCDLCGPTSYIPGSNQGIELNVAGYEGRTCGDLGLASKNLTIPAETCPSAGEVAQSVCCIEFTDVCDLCDGGDLIPTATVPFEGKDVPCQVVVSSVNETVCSAVKAQVSETCCVVPSSPAPNSAPESSATDPPTPSGTASLVSIKHLASIAGLAITAIALVMS